MTTETKAQSSRSVAEQVAAHVEALGLVKCDAEGKSRYVTYYLWPNKIMSDEDRAGWTRILRGLREMASLSDEAMEELTGIPATQYREIEDNPLIATSVQMTMILDIYRLDLSYFTCMAEGFGHVAGDPCNTELLARMAFSDTKTEEDCKAFFAATAKERGEYDWRDDPVYCDDCEEFIALAGDMEAWLAKREQEGTRPVFQKGNHPIWPGPATAVGLLHNFRKITGEKE